MESHQYSTFLRVTFVIKLISHTIPLLSHEIHPIRPGREHFPAANNIPWQV
jgi:hypothetical protein